MKVFIIGSARSGTTLVNSILWTTGLFAVYRAETLLLPVCASRYPNLRDEAQFADFLRDWFDSRQFKRSGLTKNQFRSIAEANRGNSVQLLQAFMNAVASVQGKTAWVDSTPANVFFLGQIGAEIPDARFVNVIRDGRGVATSRRRLGWTGISTGSALLDLVGAGVSWERCVKAADKSRPSVEGRIMDLGYETLVTQPERALGSLSDFLGMEIEPNRVFDSEIGSLGRANTPYESGRIGINTAAVSRWRSQLEPREVSWLDDAIGSSLLEKGYSDVSRSVARYYRRPIALILKGYSALKMWLARNTRLGRFSDESFEKA